MIMYDNNIMQVQVLDKYEIIAFLFFRDQTFNLGKTKEINAQCKTTKAKIIVHI